LDRPDSSFQTARGQFPLAKIFIQEPPEIIVNIESKPQHSTTQGVKFLLIENTNLALYRNWHGSKRLIYPLNYYPVFKFSNDFTSS
jgi:hypothetical protein